jgi:hypothetical protein
MKRTYSSTELIQAMITITVLDSGDAYWRANDALVWGEENLTGHELYKLNLEAQRIGANL